MCNIEQLGIEELELLKLRIEDRLSKFLPVRIREVVKRCGKEGCPCMSGPANNDWGNLHGPYLVASYKDRQTGKNRQLSLGPKMGADRLEGLKMRDNFIRLKYFDMTYAQKEELLTRDGLIAWECHLTQDEFKHKYGLAMADDRLNRPTTLYGTQANYDAYRSAARQQDERIAAASSIWAERYGVGSIKGWRLLKLLMADDYYIKD